MSKAPSLKFRQLRAYSLFGLYSAASTLSGALLIWVGNSLLSTPIALGQTASPAPESPNYIAQSSTTLPTAQDLLDQARQRLQDRGELPNPTTDSNIPISPSSPQFDVYRLGPGDSLFVNLRRFPNLNNQITLDLQGNVILPLIGILNLEDMTIPQARALIDAEFNRYVINPDVSLTLVAQRPVEVTILGEVVRPGLYPLPAPDVAVALVSAGGTTGLADLRAVRVRRTLNGGGGQEVVEQNLDLFTPLNEAATLPALQLQDGDVVIVPTLTARDIETYNRSLVARSTLAQPAINVRVLNFTGNLTAIALPNGSDFLDAVTTISPSLTDANLRKIALIRFDPQQGKAVIQEFDARDALSGDFSQNPQLEDNDVIVIGRNLVARITFAFNRFTQPFRDVLGFLLFFDSIRDSADNLFRPGDNNN